MAFKYNFRSLPPSQLSIYSRAKEEALPSPRKMFPVAKVCSTYITLTDYSLVWSKYPGNGLSSLSAT